MKFVINCLAAFTGFAAAAFWCKSAYTQIPDPPAGAFAEAIIPGLTAYREAARKAARSNQWAALLSGVTAALTAIGLLLP
jgi:hypothetical protein